jgi:hypothetical protein
MRIHKYISEGIPTFISSPFLLVLEAGYPNTRDQKKRTRGNRASQNQYVKWGVFVVV